MEISDYQKQAMTTCMEASDNPLYMLLGMGEEVGELPKADEQPQYRFTDVVFSYYTHGYTSAV